MDGEDCSETSVRSGLSSSIIGGRVCLHGRRVVLYTSWSKRNPGHRFMRCSSWKGDDCGYFKWMDEDFPDRQKEVILRLVESKNMLEDNIKLLKDKLEFKEEQSKKLEVKIEKLKVKIHEHQDIELKMAKIKA